LVGEYRGFGAGPKGMMDLRLLNFLGGFCVSGEFERRDGSRGEEGGVDTNDGFVVSVTNAGFVELNGSEGDRKVVRGCGIGRQRKECLLLD
jgi:hypothetical protein